MVAQPTYRPDGTPQESRDDLDSALDRALMDTFPASDPVSLVQPGPHVPEAPNRVADTDTARDRYRALPHFALHPPVHLRGRPPVRSLDEAAEAVDHETRRWSDTTSDSVLQQLVGASTPEQAEAAGRMFRAWAQERGILIVPPEDH
jgi:hypothetical protein